MPLLPIATLAVANPDVIFIDGFEAGSSAAPVSLGDASRDFGSVVVNGYSSWQAFVVRNDGDSAVALERAQIKVSSGQYALASRCGATLAAGAQCTIWVLFAPTAPGEVDAELTITAGGAVLNSQLSGTGSSGPAGPHGTPPPVPQDG